MKLWGHDAIAIEIPYVIARILADPYHPHHDELFSAISESIVSMIASSSLLEPSPVVTILDGIILDGGDVSMGPVAYLRKTFIADVERTYADLKEEIESYER